MRNEGLIKTYYADAAITKHRIVKYGSDDNNCAQATAVTEKLLGVADSLGAVAAADPVDVIMDGIATVEYGGNVTRGDWLTTDAAGKAVTAAPGVDAIVECIGRAQVSGVDGDLGSVLLDRTSLRGANA